MPEWNLISELCFWKGDLNSPIWISCLFERTGQQRRSNGNPILREWIRTFDTSFHGESPIWLGMIRTFDASFRKPIESPGTSFRIRKPIFEFPGVSFRNRIPISWHGGPISDSKTRSTRIGFWKSDSDSDFGFQNQILISKIRIRFRFSESDSQNQILIFTNLNDVGSSLEKLTTVVVIAKLTDWSKSADAL